MNSKCCYCTIKWLNEKISGLNQSKQGSGGEGGKAEVTPTEGMAEERRQLQKCLQASDKALGMALMGYVIDLPSRLEVGSPHRSIYWLLGREELAGNGEHCSYQMACLHALWHLYACFWHQQPDLDYAALLGVWCLPTQSSVSPSLKGINSQWHCKQVYCVETSGVFGIEFSLFFEEGPFWWSAGYVALNYATQHNMECAMWIV